MRPPAPASLDLHRPPAPAPPASLDLDEPATPPAAKPPAAAPPAAAPVPVAPHPDHPARRASIDRVRAGERRILTADEPTVTLTRLQSGIGTLSIDAAVAVADDLRIGALFELADRQSSTVDLAAGRRVAPSPPRPPALVARRERFEQIAADLRRCRDLRRLAVYAISPSSHWSGTLVVTTFGGARVEVPLDPLDAAKTAVLLTIYNVAGELVLRAELEPVGGVRDAARAFGYDGITWLDDRNPVA